MKKLQTEFGELEISEDAVLHFPNGIYGFEDTHDYVIINHDEQGIIMTLQTTEGQMPQFVVIDPYAVLADYQPKLSTSDKSKLGIQTEKELKFLVIAVVKENYLETVVNLKSPLAINPATNTAYQVFLENNDYSMRYPIFQQNGGK